MISYFFYEESTASKRKINDSFICTIKEEILLAQLVRALCRSAALLNPRDKIVHLESSVLYLKNNLRRIVINLWVTR